MFWFLMFFLDIRGLSMFFFDFRRSDFRRSDPFPLICLNSWKSSISTCINSNVNIAIKWLKRSFRSTSAEIAVITATLLLRKPMFHWNNRAQACASMVEKRVENLGKISPNFFGRMGLRLFREVGYTLLWFNTIFISEFSENSSYVPPSPPCVFVGCAQKLQVKLLRGK
jgi:hypothetical protein